MLSTFGGRTFSHYCASSSSPALASFLPSSWSICTGSRMFDAVRAIGQSLRLLSGAADAPSPLPSPTDTPSALGVHDEGQLDASLEQLADGQQDAGTLPVPSALSDDIRQLELPADVLRDLRPPCQPYQILPKLAQRPTTTPAMYTPWTPTRALQRRGKIARRMGFLMQVLEREHEQRVRSARPLPDFKAGDILEVRLMIPEYERKVAIYRGVCIARYNKGLRSTFKLYNVFPECGGVVQHLPLYMPDLLGIKLVGRIPATQERLFYLLERETSDYTFQVHVAAAK